MDNGSRWAIMRRALVYGACMGALIGGPVFGALFALAAVVGGPRTILVALLVTVIGGALGGMVGLVAAVLPGMAVASASDYLRGRPRIARACAAAVSGLEIDAVFVVGHGGLGAAAATGGGIAFLIFAFSLFAAVGAYGLNYVVTGQTCPPARGALRCFRRVCPCRRFRLDALSAA
jgi:hypothetical protein